MYSTPQQYRLPRRQPIASPTTTAIYSPRNLTYRPAPPLPVRYRQNVVVNVGDRTVRPPMPIVSES
ncbi:MAG: hypothetical protein ACPGVO_15240 [Spirulinaceae cyanobacterium]